MKFIVPSPPSYLDKRGKIIKKLKKYVLAKDTKTKKRFTITTIYGSDGLGKSTLASALAHKSEIKSYFSDGIFWVTLGETSNLLALLTALIEILGDYNFKAVNSRVASLHLNKLLSERKVLFVLDDLCHSQDLDAFRFDNPDCRILVTTENIVIKEANHFSLNIMSQTQSLKLLNFCLDDELNETQQQLAQQLAKKVNYLPLALEVLTAQISNGISFSQLLSDLSKDVTQLKGSRQQEIAQLQGENPQLHPG